MKQVLLLTLILGLCYKPAFSQDTNLLEKVQKDSLRTLLLRVSGDPVEDVLYKETLVQLSIIDLNYSHFDSVFITCDKLKQRFPDDPAGYLMAANAYQMMMRDYRLRTWDSQFEDQIGHAIKLATTKLKKDKSAENYFMLGSAEGYLSFHQFRKGQWLQSLNGGLKCLRNFRTCYAKKPDFVDPLLALALFEYGKSRIPLMGGDLNKAIQSLKEVYARARYVSVDALFSLQLIYYQLEEYENAFEINEQIHNRFPQSVVALYNRGLLLEAFGRWQQAAFTWTRLTSLIRDFGEPSQGYLAECHYHVAKLSVECGQHENAEKALQQALLHVANYNSDSELEGPYVTFKEVRKAIEELCVTSGMKRVTDK